MSNTHGVQIVRVCHLTRLGTIYRDDRAMLMMIIFVLLDYNTEFDDDDDIVITKEVMMKEMGKRKNYSLKNAN